uniref:Uncharacterized protein n=1 Tax=Picea sitchensis TaxID=3332 RepID=A0A6B9XTK1_PICSI|nr:hypothetical protein Q903MT_gene6855 [Picea sitchensis]
MHQVQEPIRYSMPSPPLENKVKQRKRPKEQRGPLQIRTMRWVHLLTPSLAGI